MKTERRHELQENELANWLVDYVAKIQPYGKTIAGIVVLLAAVLLGSSYLSARDAKAQQAAWAAYYDAANTNDPEDLRLVAENYPGTHASGWALTASADRLLSQAVGKLFQDRTEATKLLESAQKSYEAVAESFTDPMLLERATFGLAKTHETQGDLAKAKELYEKITKTWANSEFAVMAGQRLAQLNKPATTEWYAWFAEQKPAPDPLSDPSMLQDLPNLPDKPDFSMPQPGQLFGPSDSQTDGESSTTDGTPPTADAASGTEEPAEVTEPSTDLPAETPPAAETPAVETPAAETPAVEPSADPLPTTSDVEAAPAAETEPPAPAAGDGATLPQ